MLKALMKKQLLELHKGFFVNTKKGTTRSGAGTVGQIILYVLLMVVVLGGAFSALATALCEPLHGAGMDWLYFALISLIALLIGVFSGAFTTYTVVYQAKDNDLLLSMPIPVRYVLIARLFSVYLMGLMFTALTEIPAIVVYALTIRPGVGVIVTAALQMLCVSVGVMVLSCVLGWVVAKISARLKNRNIVKVLASLIFLIGYYVVYFRAMNNFQALIAQASRWGETVDKGNPLYFLGVAALEPKMLGLLAIIVAAAMVLCLRIMARSFLTLAVSSNSAARRKVKREAETRVSSVTASLLRKEFGRFTASANYMLNCGLGTLLLPAAGIFVFLKREQLAEALGMAFSQKPDCAAVILPAGIAMLMSMNDMASASISLEGKNIWIPQSLPVRPWQVLRAKLSVQIIMTLPMALICAALCAAALQLSAVQFAEVLVLTAINSVLFALADLTLNLKMPNLSWTNELYPIKQSGCVAIALLAPWGYAVLLGGAYLLVAYPLGAELYLGVFLVAGLAVAGMLYGWVKKKGSRIFAEL